jgi:hypothetical protein
MNGLRLFSSFATRQGGGETMAKQPWHRVQAMVLCDAAQESAEEYGVFHLHGVRSRIDAPGFPYTHPDCACTSR